MEKIDKNFKGEFSAEELLKMGFIGECECTNTDTPEYCLDFYFTHNNVPDMKLLQTIYYKKREFEWLTDFDNVFYDPDINYRTGECRFI